MYVWLMYIMNVQVCIYKHAYVREGSPRHLKNGLCPCNLVAITTLTTTRSETKNIQNYLIWPAIDNKNI